MGGDGREITPHHQVIRVCTAARVSGQLAKHFGEAGDQLLAVRLGGEACGVGFNATRNLGNSRGEDLRRLVGTLFERRRGREFDEKVVVPMQAQRSAAEFVAEEPEQRVAKSRTTRR